MVQFDQVYARTHTTTGIIGKSDERKYDSEEKRKRKQQRAP